MIDTEKVYRVINKVVQERTGKIAVYGIGKYGEALANSISIAERIFCFCDKIKESGTFANKPIIPFVKLPSEGINTVIIAAGRKGERIVYERINDFCRENGIYIYGIHSGNLTQAGRNLSSNLCGAMLKAKLWEEIAKHEVICFDIFDTLLMRRTMYPTDIFDIVEHRAKAAGLLIPKGFRNYRIQAAFSDERVEKGLSGIYQNIKKMLKLSKMDTQRLLELEMQVEREAVFPRYSMVEAGKYAKELGKKIFLVSDMYLPPDFLEQLLTEKGIDFFDKLYVSEYCGTSKDKDLFKLVRKENPAPSYMHIGDNAEADGWGARREGIDSFLIQSAIGAFGEAIDIRPFKYLDGLNDRLLLGLFLKETFADPFVLDSHSKCEVNTVIDFARLFLAPLAVSYIMWLIRKVKGLGCSAILFASRDGYLFRQMYKRVMELWGLKDMPREVYFYVSRKSCIGMAIRTCEDLEWMRSKIQGETRKFVESVFSLGFDDCELETENDSEKIWHQVMKRQQEIVNISFERCRRYQNYIKKIGLSPYDRYVFVDMCSQGTSQFALTKVLLPHLYGLYFERYNSKDIKTMGLVESFLMQEEHETLLCNIFEFVFTSPEPSVNDISEQGNVVFSEEERTVNEIEELHKAQSSILNFLDEFLSLANPDEYTSKSISQYILELYKSKLFAHCLSVFSGKSISNDLAGGRLSVREKDE